VIAFVGPALTTAKALEKFDNGRGVRAGQKLTDVLLVGTVDGVERVLNPVGSPAGPVYPLLDSASFTNGPNTGLTFSLKDRSAPFGAPRFTFPVTAGINQGSEKVAIDGTNKLTFEISPQTTANDIINAVLKDAAVQGKYAVTLVANADGTNNNG